MVGFLTALATATIDWTLGVHAARVTGVLGQFDGVLVAGGRIDVHSASAPA